MKIKSGRQVSHRSEMSDMCSMAWVQGVYGWSTRKAQQGRTVSMQFLRFQILTFDKPRFPRSLILAWKSPYLHFPLYFYPLYDFHIKMNTDKKTRTD